MARPMNAPKPLPDVDMLNMLLRYDAETGKLFWRERPLDTFLETPTRPASFLHGMWNTKFSGKEAGGLHSGYMRCMVNNEHHLHHRIIWKMAYGVEPDQVDHIDGNRSNNRLSNLRDVSHQVNAKNRRLYANNTTGVPGVSFHKRDNVWQVRINVGEEVEVHLGNYAERDTAVAVRLAAQTLLDYHENHGRKALQ